MDMLLLFNNPCVRVGSRLLASSFFNRHNKTAMRHASEQQQTSLSSPLSFVWAAAYLLASS
jgi:hypothetical protein